MLAASELQPYESNPRNHPVEQIEQIKNSIRQWGWTVPILIDEDSTVIAGHGRLYAAMELGLNLVPCVVAKGWSEEQKRGYVIADNRLAENSNWDNAMYFSEIKALDDIGFDLSLAGLDAEQAAALSYQPNLSPNTEYLDVTNEDVERVASTLGDIAPKTTKIVELVCPHCGEDIEFEGM
jgi:hypothetical protein